MALPRSLETRLPDQRLSSMQEIVAIRPVMPKMPIRPVMPKMPIRPVRTKMPIRPVMTKMPIRPVLTKMPTIPVLTKMLIRPVLTKMPIRPVLTKMPIRPVLTKMPIRPVMTQMLRHARCTKSTRRTAVLQRREATVENKRGVSLHRRTYSSLQSSSMTSARLLRLETALPAKAFWSLPYKC